MKKVVISILCAGVLGASLFFSGVFSPHTSEAQNASEQAQIQALLVLIGQLQQQLAALLGQGSCTILTQNLYIGLKDDATAGQVSKLQKFLKSQGDYTYPTITGFYGALTQQAVQHFQARVGIVSGGSPATNGYGVAGPTTRAKIQAISCGTPGVPVPVVPPAVPLVPPIQQPLVSLPAGAVVSCTPSVTSIMQGQSVTWTAFVSGAGSTPLTYSWTGTSNLSGNGPVVTKTYSSVGTKTAKVTVNGVQVSCSSSVAVVENPALTYNISCSANTTQIDVGENVIWTATVSGGTTPYTYAWDGSEGLSGGGASISKTYNSAGDKTASVTINGVDGADCSNEVEVLGQEEEPPIETGGAIVWPPQGQSSKAIYAYSLKNLSGSYNNIFKLHWLGVTGGNAVPPVPVATEVSWALSDTASMPAGHKVMYMRNVMDWLFRFKDLNTNTWKDMCIDPATGNPQLFDLDLTGTTAAYFPHLLGPGGQPATTIVQKPMPCWWWDEGKDFTEDWLDDFFSAYKNAGGQLNAMVLDIEAIASYRNSNLFVIQQKCDQARTDGNPATNCPISWCEGIANDSRFPPDDDFPFPNDFVAKVCKLDGTPDQWYHLFDNLREFDEWLYDHMADYEEEAVLDVARDYFPDVTMSDYGFFNWDDYEMPYGTNPMFLSDGNGAHAGTHQGVFIYGDQPVIPNATGLEFLYPYPQTAFNSFRYYTNWAKSAYLSDDAPLAPWITDKAYAGSQVANSDLYQEMLIHTGMSNTDYFIHWNGNPSGSPTVPTLIDSIISELELMIGYQDAQPLSDNDLLETDDITDWDTDYVYSAVRVGNYNVWRFTPKSMSGLVMNAGNADGNSSVVLEAAGDTITFPSAMIYTPANPVSTQGVWIIQNADASNPTIAYAGGGSGGQFASAWEAYKSMGEYILNSVINVKSNLADLLYAWFW